MNRYRVDGPTYPRFPRALVHPLGPFFRHLPLSLRRHLLHFRAYGSWGNFNKPQSWSEKTQWRILNDRRKFLGVACDKIAAKTYASDIAAKAGIPLRIPETYWAGTDVRELQKLSDQLPSRWVFKPNHSSGRFVILDTAESPIDWDEMTSDGKLWIQRDEEELVLGHYGYSLARHLLIAEERVGKEAFTPATFRAYVVNQEVLYCSYSYGTIHPNNPSPRKSFRYDGKLNRRHDEVYGVPALPNEHSRIDRLDREAKRDLLQLIRALSSDLEHVRVDLFVEDEVWFGELTAYSGGGIMHLPSSYIEPIATAWILPDLSVRDPKESLWEAMLSVPAVGTLQTNRKDAES